MSRFSNILSQSLAAKPALESEGAAKVDEAPLVPAEVIESKTDGAPAADKGEGEAPKSPTELVSAGSEAAEGAPAKGEGEAPLSPTEVVEATPVIEADDLIDVDAPVEAALEALGLFNAAARAKRKVESLEKNLTKAKADLATAKADLKTAESDLSKADGDKAKKAAIKKIAAARDEIEDQECIIEGINDSLKVAKGKIKAGTESQQEDAVAVISGQGDVAVQEGEVPLAEGDGEVKADPEVVQDPADADVEVSLEELGEQLVGVVEAEEVVDRHNDAVSELSSVGDSLRRTQGMIEASLPEGGLDPQAAAFMHDAVSDRARRLNAGDVVVPSVESFGSETPRYDATVAALEGVQEFNAQVGRALKATLEKVKQVLAALLAKLLTFGGTIGARNKALAAAVAKIPSSTTQKSGKIKIGDVASRIAVGSDVSVNELAKLPGVIESTLSFDTANEEALAKAIHQITELAKAAETATGEDAAEFGGKFLDAYAATMNLTAPKAFHSKGEDVAETDVLPGNVSLLMKRLTADAGATAAHVARNPWRLEKVEHEATIPEGGEVSTASLADVAAIVKHVAEIAAMSDRVAKQKSYDKLTFGELDLSKISSAPHRKMVEQAIASYSQRLSLVHQASAKALSYGLRVASNFQTYGFKSLEAYGVGEVAPAAAPAPAAA